MVIVCLRGCMLNSRCVCLYGCCVVFVCVSGHVCMVSVCLPGRIHVCECALVWRLCCVCMWFWPCLYGDCVWLNWCMCVCARVCLYGDRVVFVCVSGHACMATVCACVCVIVRMSVNACVCVWWLCWVCM